MTRRVSEAMGISLLLRSESAGDLAERFLIGLVADLAEASCHFETHTLAISGCRAILHVEAFEEIVHRHAQAAGNLEQASGRHAIDAAFVFVLLLIRHANDVGQLLLGQSQHDPALADARPDMAVDSLA